MSRRKRKLPLPQRRINGLLAFIREQGERAQVLLEAAHAALTKFVEYVKQRPQRPFENRDAHSLRKRLEGILETWGRRRLLEAVDRCKRGIELQL